VFVLAGQGAAAGDVGAGVDVGGPSPNALAESLGRWLPVGARTLDVVVTASPKPDSLGGLPGLFERFEIEQAVLSGEAGRNAAYREWSEGLAPRKIEVTVADVGLSFDLGEGAVLRVIDANKDGATLRLDYGDASFLFPAGLEAKSSTELASGGAILPATVLLAPDHAGKNSISALFLDAAQPQAIVVAVGDGNRPDEQTLALFAGRTVLRTDERGVISFATDGKELWIESER
jgi:competence protein ComEC